MSTGRRYLRVIINLLTRPAETELALPRVERKSSKQPAMSAQVLVVRKRQPHSQSCPACRLRLGKPTIFALLPRFSELGVRRAEGKRQAAAMVCRANDRDAMSLCVEIAIGHLFLIVAGPRYHSQQVDPLRHRWRSASLRAARQAFTQIPMWLRESFMASSLPALISRWTVLMETRPVLRRPPGTACGHR